MTSTELRELIARVTDKNCPSYICTRAELASQINYSTSALSLWMNDKYSRNSEHIERALEAWLDLQTPSKHEPLSNRDQRKLSYIRELILHAENSEAIVQAILESRAARGTAKSGTTNSASA